MIGLIIFLLLTAILNAAPTTPFQGNVLLRYEQQKFIPVTMKNGLLDLHFLPESMGRINSIKISRTGLELLVPYQAKILSGNPLFLPKQDNFQGIREILWQTPMTDTCVPVKIESQTEEEIVFSSRYYGNTLFGLRRRIHLLPDSFELDFQIELTNNGTQSDSCSIWMNLVSPEPAYPIIPVKGGRQPLRNKGIVHFSDKDFLARYIKKGSTTFPPARCWAGTAFQGMTWCIVFSPSAMEKDGFFYSWYGKTPEGTLRTFEPVFGSRKLRPGEKCTLNYRLLFFPELPYLRDVLLDNGINAVIKDSRLEVTFAAVRSTTPMNGSILANGKTLKTFQLPQRRPGDTASVSVEIPQSEKNDFTIKLEDHTTQLIMEDR